MRTQVFTGLSSLLILSGMALAAQEGPPEPPNCPLNIRGGEWNLKVSGTDSATARFNGSEVPMPPIGDFLMFLPSCEAGLSIVSRGGIRADLTGRNDGNFPSEFRGSGSITGPITAEWSITVSSQTSAQGQLSLGGLFDRVATGGAVHYDMNFAEDETEDHPACSCPSQLRAALSDQIKDAKRLRDLYANTAYYQRPAAFSPDIDPTFRRWNVFSYDELVTYLYRNPNGTYDQGVAYVDSVTSDGGQIRKGADTDATTGDTRFSASGVTTFENGMCHMTVSSGNDSCYPDIAYAAVSEHERVHYTECETNNGLPKDIPLAAAGEVRAYGAEIDYLRSWIPKNCSGPVANVTD